MSQDYAYEDYLEKQIHEYGVIRKPLTPNKF